jgi:hypothetical protein
MGSLIARIRADVDDEVAHSLYGLEAVPIVGHCYISERCSLCDELHRMGLSFPKAILTVAEDMRQPGYGSIHGSL